MRGALPDALEVLVGPQIQAVAAAVLHRGRLRIASRRVGLFRRHHFCRGGRREEVRINRFSRSGDRLFVHLVHREAHLELVEAYYSVVVFVDVPEQLVELVRRQALDAQPLDALEQLRLPQCPRSVRVQLREGVGGHVAAHADGEADGGDDGLHRELPVLVLVREELCHRQLLVRHNRSSPASPDIKPKVPAVVERYLLQRPKHEAQLPGRERARAVGEAEHLLCDLALVLGTIEHGAVRVDEGVLDVRLQVADRAQSEAAMFRQEASIAQEVHSTSQVLSLLDTQGDEVTTALQLVE
mmetsp:Transcript_35368/g.97615  ORF Transcript_35368/g.97615 Transcript_35368/m.97615 type:complete len:298 (-) Transcript_35368:59-952(-)